MMKGKIIKESDISAAKLAICRKPAKGWREKFGGERSAESGRWYLQKNGEYPEYPENLEYLEKLDNPESHKKNANRMQHSVSVYYVPRAGVEPARVAPLVFETSASTDSAIWA